MPDNRQPLSAGIVRGMKKLPLLVALLTLPATAWSQPKPKDCGPLPPPAEKVAFAGDGDTIYLVGWPWGVRLWGSNAPELRDHDKAETIPGMKARALTASRLSQGGNKASCEPIEWDSYCRVVATCTSGGKDLTLELLKAGLSYTYYLAKHPALVDRAMSYAKAEEDARKARAGLWPYWLGEKPLVEQASPRP